MSYKLENWHLTQDGIEDPYKAPEYVTQHLCGQVYGNPNFKDGDNIRTTSIVGIEGECIVTLSGSRYELGQPNKDYENAFPNAKERLIKRIKEFHEPANTI